MDIYTAILKNTKIPLNKSKRYLHVFKHLLAQPEQLRNLAKLKSCCEDFEFLTRFSRDTFDLYRKCMSNDSVAKSFSPEQQMTEVVQHCKMNNSRVQIVVKKDDSVP